MTTPSDPGTGYVLDWQDPAQRVVPGSAPPGWAVEYDPSLVHTDGNPQVMASGSAPLQWWRAPTSNGLSIRDLAFIPVALPFSFFLRGRWCGRFQLEASDPLIHNGIRAEVAANSIEPAGSERWYGFSIYLPSSWVSDTAADIVTQWHQHWQTSGGPPSLALETHNGQWRIGQAWENYDVHTAVGPYATNRWTDWVVHARWASNRSGLHSNMAGWAISPGIRLEARTEHLYRPELWHLHQDRDL